MKKRLLIFLFVLTFAAIVSLIGCSPANPNVESIEITNQPTSVYIQGETLLLAGGQILVKYQGNATQLMDINESMLSSFDPYTLGDQIIRVNYGGKSTSFTVTVLAPRLDKVELQIDQSKVKTQYIAEQDVAHNGLSMLLTYVGGAERIVPVTRDMIFGYDPLRLGEQELSVRYAHNEDIYTRTYTVKVVAKQLVGLEVSTLPTKRVYYIGDTLDLTGGTLFLRYDNGYPVYIEMRDLPGLEAEADTSRASGATTVTLTYGGRTAKFNIEVIVKDVLSLEVLQMPSEQLVNTPLNLDGFRVEVIYSNGQSEILIVPDKKVYYEGSVPNEDIVYSIYAYGYDTSRPGNTTVRLRIYSGGTLLATESTITLAVKDKSITDIEIYRTLEFTQEGEPIDEANIYTMTTFRPFEDWSYVLIFNNGERYAPRPLQMGMIADSHGMSEFGYETAGTVAWVIDYQDDEDYIFDGYYQFEVLPLAIDEVALYTLQDDEYTPLAFVNVFMNDAVNTEGLHLLLSLNNGSEMYIPFRADMIDYDNFDNSNIATSEIPIQINLPDLNIRSDASVPVVVLKKVIGSLGIVSEPTNKNYVLFNEEDLAPTTRFKYFFNYNGLVIDINFEGDSTHTRISDFSSDDWQFSYSEWTSPETYGKFYSTGIKKIFITYIGLDNPDVQGVYIEVNVTNRVTGIEFNSPSLGYIYAGAELNLEGRAISIFYENGTVTNLPLTPDMLDYKVQDTTEGGRDVTITYREGETFMHTTTIEVFPNEPYAIEVFRLPYVLEYVHNQSDALDTTGIIVNLLYRNGTRTVLNESEYQCDNFSSAELGQVMIVVQHTTYHYETEFFIDIKEAAVTAIEWVGPAPVVVIQEGVDFAINTAKTVGDTMLSAELVRLVYSGGIVDTEERTLGSIAGELTIHNYNKYSAVEQYPEIVYGESAFLRLKAQVFARVLTSISADPGQFSVVEYSDINLSAAKLRLVFDYGLSENVVPLLKEYIAYDPVTNPLGYNREDTTLGWRAVNIRYTYNGITRENTISVNVLPKQLMGIGMKDLPKIKYLEGDPLDLAGGTVLIFYNNNTTEVLELKNATVNMAGSSFNINAIRFDNSEFGGISKLQTIYVNYIWNNTVFETDFDIIMQDRRYAAVNFNSNNIYEFVYGALNEDNAPQFTVTGYNSFEDTQRALTLAHPNDYSKVTIEYVPYEERLSPRDPFRDYTAIPREVGEYLIVISYDAASYNDRVHNSFVTSENETRIITIRKKKIFVELEDVTKVYGTANPVYNIVAYGTDSAGLLSLTAAPFAFDEDFFSPYFANQEINHGGLCYYLDTPIHYIRIVTKSSTGTVISINTQSSAGNYFVEISAIESGNYDIQYLSSTFIVERREVAVYSNDITVTYGTTSINYTYTTGKVPDGMGGYIQDSGLFGDDLLTGTLMKDGESNSVGKYLIHTGNLGNANYRIIYNPGIEGNKYLTIVKRNIYIKAESYTKIFGTENPDFILEYFSDETCLDSEGAFAFSADRQQKLGNRGFFTLAETLSPIGHYNIVPVITPYSEEYLDGREDIFGNYNIIYISGILQILPRPLNLTISSASKLYGESDPQEFAYVASAVQGVPESGLLTDIFGNLDELQGSLQRQAGEFVGRYAIEISNLISLNPNYAITYNRADFVIAQKDIYILIEEENLSKIYDGKTPSLSSYRVTHLTNGEYEDYTHNYLNPASISLAFENPSRNIGDYFISVANNNPNYRVQFPEGSEYYYTITPREVNISYVDLPDMQEYRGTAYTFYAVVNDSDIQYQYNADGSIRTDDNNRELKDTVEVTLTAVNALNAADYAVSPVRLSDPNYVLSEAARVETSFTILKRELVIEVLTANDVQADDDGITYEAIYDNMSVILFENEHYVVHNALTQIPILINVRVVDPIHPDEVNISPQNVRYTSDFQEIISYDITAEQPTNNNFTVRMQKEYKFKILPRRVAVTMTEMMLTKQYDNTGPSIDSSMFHIEDMQTSLDFNTISFEFTRSDQTRSNTEVGIYEISIFCSDRNHIVETLGGRIYTYTITKRAVNVALNADALTKVYDGTPISFRQENITYTGMAGIQPNVKSFSDPAEIDAMQAWFDYLAQEVLIFRNLLNINFQNKAVSKGRIEDALSAASVLRNKYLDPQSEQYITPSNYTTILNTIGKTTDTTGTDSVIGRLKEVLEYFDHADYNIPDAQAKFRIATALVDALYNATDSERSYIAFRIEGADANNIDVGSYKITMIYNDYNRSYTFLNAQVTDCYYYITIWEITLRTDTVISTYGEVVPDSVPYTIWHNDTQIAPDDPRINILGKLVVDFRTSPYRVGEFDIIADGEMSDNVNYFINVAANKFVVTKAVLTIKLNEHIGTANDPHPVAEEKIIYYGDSVGINRLKYWDVEGLVAPQPGMPVDTRDVINDQPAVFTAMVNGLNIIDPLSRPDAGTYSIEASGFLAANYTFEREVGGVLVSTVVPGKITINKKALEIASTLGVLDRNYGTPITLNYIGFEYGEDVAVLGANFAQPLPTNPNSPAFNLLTPVSFDEYEVSFYVHPDDADQFTNYVFDVDDKYYRVRVNRAELTMRLVGTGLNGSLTAEYGSDPQYQVIYEGFKNDESHSVYPVFDFQKEVRDTVAFGESNVLAYTELANYTLRIASVPYSVTPKNLYVSLIDIDEDLPIGTPLTINTVYDPLLGNAYVGPYRTQYHYDIATIEDPETGQTYEEEYISLIEILRGQYWKNNFHFVGFAYEDTADNLFSKYSYNDDNYFEYTALYEHNITTTGNIGEGLKYSVSGLNFMYYDNPGQSGNDPANYNLIYQEMDLNIYLKASALLPNGDLILLEGDAPETLTVKTIMENGQINILTLDNEYLVYDESGSSYPMSADENGVVYVKYSRSFSINRYIGDEYLMPEVEEDDDEEGDDPGDPGDPGDEEGAPISSLIEHNILNETEYFNIFVRLHKKDTVTYNGELKDESDNSYAYGSVIDATTNTVQYTDTNPTNTKNYDRIDTSIRLLPSAAGYSYSLIVNQDESGENSVVLVFERGSAAKLVITVDGEVLTQTIALEFDGIDIFDGFTHSIRLYFDKRLGLIYVMLDGTMSVGMSISALYTPIEDSIAGFALSGAKAWVRHFETAKQGYRDNYASLVKSANNERIILYVTSPTSTTPVNLTRIFTPRVPPTEEYEYHYYFDGVLEGIITNAGGDITLYNIVAGVHKAEMVIFRGTEIYSKYTLSVQITTSVMNGYVQIDTSHTHDVSPSSPYSIYSFTAVDPDNPDELKMENVEVQSKQLELRFPQTVGAENNYRSISMSFTMDIATIGDDYRASQTQNFIKLATNRASYDPAKNTPPPYSTDFGIVLGINHNRTGALAGYFNTTLYAFAGQKTYYYDIPREINWNDGSMYTVRLYTDYVTAMGGESFKLVILRDNEILENIVVDREFLFTGVNDDSSPMMSSANMQTLVRATGRTAAIKTSDNRLTLYKLNFGEENSVQKDYLINGSYVQKTANGVTFGSSSAQGTYDIALSDTNENILYSHYNHLLFEFSASRFASSTTSRSLIFNIAASELDMNDSSFREARGLRLVYDSDTKILYFTFYNKLTNFALQKVATGIELMDGERHTILVHIDRLPVARGNIPGVYSAQQTTQVSRVNITVDGITYKSNEDTPTAPLCFPYNASMTGWINSVGNVSPADGISGYQFLKAFNYSALRVVDAEMTIFAYQVGMGIVTDHIQSQAGDALI